MVGLTVRWNPVPHAGETPGKGWKVRVKVKVTRSLQVPAGHESALSSAVTMTSPKRTMTKRIMGVRWTGLPQWLEIGPVTFTFLNRSAAAMQRMPIAANQRKLSR